MNTERTIKLNDDRVVLLSDYVKAKTLDLIEFGYQKLTEEEVMAQVELILSGSKNLSVIGRFCERDLKC